MATMDDMDPAQASHRSNEQLQAALMRLDDHIVALTQPTIELALAQQKRIADDGLEALEPSALTRKFISSATGPASAQYYAPVPGQLNPDASEPPGVTEQPLPFRTGQEQAPLPSIPSRPGGQPSIIPGVSQQQKENIEQEQYFIPQYGQFRLDAYLRMARKTAMAKAGETEPGSEEPNRWASVAGGLNTLVEKAPEYAAGYQAAKSYLGPILDTGFAASRLGTSLGYSPQAGTGLNASHILGIPNPIAAFTSPAAKQGLGMTTNALEQSLLGTGIGVSEAKNLSNALAAQGWSNTREGGAFGFDVGGPQATLENTLAPLIKKGFNSPKSIEQLAEGTNMLRLGQATPEELKKTFEELFESAKVLHKTIEITTEGMEDFAAKAVEGGSTMIHGAKAYNSIATSTGMNPTIIQSINQSPFGKVQAMSEGVKPWDIETMSGPEQALNAVKTLERQERYTPTMPGRTTTNALGEVHTTSPEAEKYAYIHGVLHGPTAEQAKRLHEIAAKLPMQEATGEMATRLKQERENAQGRRTAESPAATVLATLLPQITAEEHHLELLKKKEHTPFPTESEHELERQLSTTKELASKAAKTATAKGAWSSAEQTKQLGELQGPKGLYAAAKKAGIPQPELEKIEHEDTGKSQWRATGSIEAALNKLNQVNIEKQNEENAKIELTGAAKKWFELKFPNTKTPKEEANAGGKSTASGATNSTGLSNESAQWKSIVNAQEKLHRFEEH